MRTSRILRVTNELETELCADAELEAVRSAAFLEDAEAGL